MEQSEHNKKRMYSSPTPLHTGIIWNIFALGFLAAAGILLNIAVARFYSPDALGLFNIVFALFILVSQLSTFGLQNATLQNVSVHSGNHEKTALIIKSAIVSVVLVNAFILPLAFAASGLITYFYVDVPNLSKAWLLVVPGLLFFSLNKVMLAGINGLSLMRVYALFVALRFILILLILSILISVDAVDWSLPLTFSVAEILLFPFLLFYLHRRKLISSRLRGLLLEIKERIRFGSRVFVSSTLSELNTRVDILMLGMILQAKDVGIYTVALLIFDAATQIVAVIRNNLNPHIARNISRKNFGGLLKTSRKSALGLAMVFSAAALFAWFLFPYAIEFVLKKQVYQEALEPMIILLLALAVAGGGMTFNMTLNQSNFPGWQSVFVGIVVIINITANFIFIPRYGVIGAALGTATALIASVFINRLLVRYLTGARIIF